MKKLLLLAMAAPLLAALGGCGVVGGYHSPIVGNGGPLLTVVGSYPGDMTEYRHYEHSHNRVRPTKAAKEYMKGRAFKLMRVSTRFDPVEKNLARKQHVLPQSAYQKMLAWQIRRGLRHGKLNKGLTPAVRMSVAIKSEAFGAQGCYFFTVMTLRKRSGSVLARLPYWTLSNGTIWYRNDVPWYQVHQRMIPSMAIVLVRTAKILNEGKTLNHVHYWRMGFPDPYEIGSRYGIKNPMTLKQTEQATGFTLAQLKAIQKRNLHSNAS